MTVIRELRRRADCKGAPILYGMAADEIERLRAAAVKAIDILHRNLYHQTEKCEDAILVLRRVLYPPQDDLQQRAQREE